MKTCRILLFNILLCLAACQTAERPIETTAPIAPATRAIGVPPLPTAIPRAMVPAESSRVLDAPTLSDPVVDTSIIGTSILPTLSSIAATESRLSPFVIPAGLTATADPDVLAAWMTFNAQPDNLPIGVSAGGMPIQAWRIGSADANARVLMIVGGMHGGWELNTVALALQLIAHYAANPDMIPTNTALIILPAANPDGMAYGRSPQGRFNGNGVDLNRNWACDWAREAVWRDMPVNPGGRAMSEPETAGIAAFIQTTRPAAVIFYHSAANGIFAGECDGDHDSLSLAAVYGEAADYPYGAVFSAYPVTGTAASWVDGQGIPSADIELLGSDSPEFERNRAGVTALLAWVAAR